MFLLFQRQVSGSFICYIYITVSIEAVKNLLSVVFKNINDDIPFKRSHESRSSFETLFKKQNWL